MGHDLDSVDGCLAALLDLCEQASRQGLVAAVDVQDDPACPFALHMQRVVRNRDRALDLIEAAIRALAAERAQRGSGLSSPRIAPALAPASHAG